MPYYRNISRDSLSENSNFLIIFVIILVPEVIAVLGGGKQLHVDRMGKTNFPDAVSCN